MISRIGTTYHFDFTIDGRRFRGSTGTTNKKLAAEFAAQRHAEAYRTIRLGEQPEAARMTLSVACVRFYAEVGKGTNYGEGAQQDHMTAWRGVLGADACLSSLSDRGIAAAVQALRAGGKRGPATINRHLSTLSAVCKRARDNWGVEVGPWKMALHRQDEPAGKETFLNYEQAKSILDHLVPHARGPVLLALYTGLRKANVLGLRGDNVSLDLGRLVLRQKGDRPFSVPLVPGAIALLRVVGADKAGPGAVFRYPGPGCECAHCRSPANAGRPIVDIRTALSTAARAAGLGHLGLRFHDLRHTLASWLLAETGDISLVKAALGHSEIKTTMRYAHLMPGAREKATAAVADKLNTPAKGREVA